MGGDDEGSDGNSEADTAKTNTKMDMVRVEPAVLAVDLRRLRKTVVETVDLSFR